MIRPLSPTSDSDDTDSQDSMSFQRLEKICVNSDASLDKEKQQSRWNGKCK